MDAKEALVQLRHLYQGKDWFADVGTDQYGRFVVYIKYTCEETLRGIADYHEGVQVVVHLDASRTATRAAYVETPGAIKFTVIPAYTAPAPAESVEVVEEDKSLRHLTDELDKLEKLCGTNTLQDIFYEIHDGPNSVTNLSSRYPIVRKSLDRLYDEYGFDVIYEEMDG